jgi:hypothetical protein
MTGKVQEAVGDIATILECKLKAELSKLKARFGILLKMPDLAFGAHCKRTEKLIQVETYDN